MTPLLLTAALALAAAPGEAPAKPSPPLPEAKAVATNAPPAYEPISAYELRTIEGWSVRVHTKLLGEQKDLGARVLEHLRVKLHDVNFAIPAPARKKLRGVVIWMEAHNPKVPGGCYHPSRRWLENNGYNPEKEKAIEFGMPENFLAWSRTQPSMVLHELAHAYHHLVVGHGNPKVKAAFRRMAEGKGYESVRYADGKTKRAYALNNDQEYFAETSEAFFATNDFFPFVRGELIAHDPEMFRLLKALWGA